MLGTRELPCVALQDHDIYVLNPLYRLRNETQYVLLFGCQGVGVYRLHRTLGIILALCDGTRTVADISQITSAFVRTHDAHKARMIASHRVKHFLCAMTKTKQEQGRQGRTRSSMFPCDAPVLSKDECDSLFGKYNLPTVRYDARSFAPKDSSEVALGPYRVRHAATPVCLIWHLTSECSTDCKYCYLGRRHIEPMPKERALALVNEAAELGVLAIDTNGGDVLLYPHLLAVFEEMRKHKFLPRFISTKSYLSPEKARELAGVSEGIWEVQFSIDSDDEQIADYMTGTVGYCERIYRSIANALDAGLNVTAKAVVTPYNILTVPRLYRNLRRRGVSKVRLAAYGRSGFHHTDDLFNHSESYKWLETETKKLQEEFPDDNVRIQNGEPVLERRSVESRKESWERRNFCSAGHSSMVICADGKVIPCEQMPEIDEYVCGDVSYQTIQEVWNGERLREVTYGIPRERFGGTACHDCEEREECHEFHGLCIRDTSVQYGTIYLPSISCWRADLPFVRLT